MSTARLILPVKFSKRATDAESLCTAMDNVVKCGRTQLADCWDEYGGEPQVGKFLVLDMEAIRDNIGNLRVVHDLLIAGMSEEEIAKDDGLQDILKHLLLVREFLEGLAGRKK